MGVGGKALKFKSEKLRDLQRSRGSGYENRVRRSPTWNPLAPSSTKRRERRHQEKERTADTSDITGRGQSQGRSTLNLAEASATWQAGAWEVSSIYFSAWKSGAAADRALGKFMSERAALGNAAPTLSSLLKTTADIVTLLWLTSALRPGQHGEEVELAFAKAAS